MTLMGLLDEPAAPPPSVEEEKSEQPVVLDCEIESMVEDTPKPIIPVVELANEDVHYIMLPKLMNSCGVVIGEPFQSHAQRKLYHKLGRFLVEQKCAEKVRKSGTYAITDYAAAKEWVMETVDEPENRFKLQKRYRYN